MFTCGNNALVVGDTAIVKFGFPTNHVKFNGAVNTYECVIVAIQFDAIAVEFLFVKQTRKENMSLVHVPHNSNNKELTFTVCRSTV
jgi:hypothetical protein